MMALASIGVVFACLLSGSMQQVPVQSQTLNYLNVGNGINENPLLQHQGNITKESHNGIFVANNINFYNIYFPGITDVQLLKELTISSNKLAKADVSSEVKSAKINTTTEMPSIMKEMPTTITEMSTTTTAALTTTTEMPTTTTEMPTTMTEAPTTTTKMPTTTTETPTSTTTTETPTTTIEMPTTTTKMPTTTTETPTSTTTTETPTTTTEMPTTTTEMPTTTTEMPTTMTETPSTKIFTVTSSSHINYNEIANEICDAAANFVPNDDANYKVRELITDMIGNISCKECMKNAFKNMYNYEQYKSLFKVAFIMKQLYPDDMDYLPKEINALFDNNTNVMIMNHDKTGMLVTDLTIPCRNSITKNFYWRINAVFPANNTVKFKVKRQVNKHGLCYSPFSGSIVCDGYDLVIVGANEDGEPVICMFYDEDDFHFYSNACGSNYGGLTTKTRSCQRNTAWILVPDEY